jgi:hypothetical protein
VVTHDNIHIPSESFPHWIWFVIEFIIVFATATLISRAIMGVFQNFEEPIQNWIFWGLVSLIFIAWYIAIRSFILKKPILEGRR